MAVHSREKGKDILGEALVYDEHILLHLIASTAKSLLLYRVRYSQKQNINVVRNKVVVDFSSYIYLALK